MTPSESEKLVPGLYDKLLAEPEFRQLAALGDPRLFSVSNVDAESSDAAIAQYLEHLLAASLQRYRGEEAAEKQRRLVDLVVQVLQAELGEEWIGHLRLTNPLQRLLAVYASTTASRDRPDTPLSRSALLTGTRLDPSLASQLSKEFAHADRIDILCSFIKWSGLRLVIDALRTLTSQPTADGTPRLRLITTSYMGATDPKAVEALSDLPHTEVRVSYDTKRTRLHAKAYLIHRRSGFGCAYVGSANMSQAALSEGLEWTPKISQYELPHLWAKVTGTFETYWNDEEFEPFNKSARPKLREAIQRERPGETVGGASSGTFFNLHPYPYQEEILDVFAAEREVQGKNRHLLVAATGTGKTMIAAFDYRNWSAKQLTEGRIASLLFIAHREEILRQALGTYRAVLRDQNFGDLLVGGHEPQQNQHLFCSIQSYNSRRLYELAPEHFDYVVVDEFHHAEAYSYQKLLEHVRPQVLLGMTATPERSDGLDVLRWFGGETSAEIRLPDAINRRLLCPFQYFGIADSEDLSGLSWQRGGYRVDELDQRYTGNDVRADLVISKVHELLLDANQARGIGFCVSITHANYMAKYFSDRGLPSLALSAESPRDVRDSAQKQLELRKVNFLFVVDLYNEGVDIPAIDTVLLLRPTESLTVYLQQLGRGLRLHPGKECLTVLDFIGIQNREFRFAPRLRALSTEPTLPLDVEIEQQFPHLPAGCAVQFERVAQQRVLDNIRQAIQWRRPAIVTELRRLGDQLQRQPTMREALDYMQLDLHDLLKRGLWSRLLAEARLADPRDIPDEDLLSKSFQRLASIDDPHQIQYLLEWLRGPGDVPADLIEQRRLIMLLVALYGPASLGWSLAEACARLRANTAAVHDLIALLEYRLRTAHTRLEPLDEALSGPLALHASYSRDEILAGLGHWTLEKRPSMREGVLHLAAARLDVFFVTLGKTLEAYSPTTMYEDYAISDRLFHWQTQSGTTPQSPTGQRYIHHRQQRYTPLLFVRDQKKLPNGLTAPYAYLGPADYVSHEGSRPMSIIWKLRHSMPARLVRVAAKQSIA